MFYASQIERVKIAAKWENLSAAWEKRWMESSLLQRSLQARVRGLLVLGGPPITNQHRTPIKWNITQVRQIPYWKDMSTHRECMHGSRLWALRKRTGKTGIMETHSKSAVTLTWIKSPANIRQSIPKSSYTDHCCLIYNFTCNAGISRH